MLFLFLLHFDGLGLLGQLGLLGHGPLDDLPVHFAGIEDEEDGAHEVGRRPEQEEHGDGAEPAHQEEQTEEDERDDEGKPGEGAVPALADEPPAQAEQDGEAQNEQRAVHEDAVADGVAHGRGQNAAQGDGVRRDEGVEVILEARTLAFAHGVEDGVEAAEGEFFAPHGVGDPRNEEEFIMNMGASFDNLDAKSRRR